MKRWIPLLLCCWSCQYFVSPAHRQITKDLEQLFICTEDGRFEQFAPYTHALFTQRFAPQDLRLFCTGMQEALGMEIRVRPDRKSLRLSPVQKTSDMDYVIVEYLQETIVQFDNPGLSEYFYNEVKERLPLQKISHSSLRFDNKVYTIAMRSGDAGQPWRYWPLAANLLGSVQKEALLPGPVQAALTQQHR